MNKPTLDNLGPAARLRALAQAGELEPKRKVKGKGNPAHWQGKEAGFQRVVEQWLVAIGYAKRNKRDILGTRGKGGRNGWQIHVQRAQANPFLLDILLLDTKENRWLEIELKTAKGVVSEIQGLLLGDKEPCRSLDEVQRVVWEWPK